MTEGRLCIATLLPITMLTFLTAAVRRKTKADYVGTKWVRSDPLNPLHKGCWADCLKEFRALQLVSPSSLSSCAEFEISRALPQPRIVGLDVPLCPPPLPTSPTRVEALLYRTFYAQPGTKCSLSVRGKLGPLRKLPTLSNMRIYSVTTSLNQNEVKPNERTGPSMGTYSIVS